ncbi:hypothetical protein DFH06DRAFT_1247657 [Mycena polygramma]|nr:hypothetical protein DFH06DRAFT_1247657 [Mycena polygramma]
MSQPSLPPELIALIISHLRDSKHDLLECSLVCHGWLSFARNELDILLKPNAVATFLELVGSPRTTILPNLRSLIIWSSPQSPVSAILQMLPSFGSLRSLKLWHVIILEGLPPALDLPLVEILGFTDTTFPSYTCFRGFVAGLPALHTLALKGISWTTGPENEEPAFPPLELQSLELAWVGKSLAIEIVTRVTRTRRLTLVVPALAPSSVLATISGYLRYLGNHLHQLVLNYRGFRMDHVYALDFGHSSALTLLKIENALRLSLPIDGEPSVLVRPMLSALMSQIMRHVPLRTLVLEVQCGLDTMEVWAPLAEFAALMDISPSPPLRTIQFVVHGFRFCLDGSARLAREKCEPILRAAIKSCPGREVECLDGESG